ncbi:MFS transporter [Demequina mangrovi]|uniref:Major Facilitator Superfamily protein n=1 Tax=Demequina mangrovi TaxID=1043493 RepID=A0A1H7AKR8_9MICO|nr:MFS transporter [Demequina mangrovi]SEJ66231.1 Major Facilitator Superfamily protein [Demequina mangrovi]
MLSPYRGILALPGARAFTAWGLVARMQMGLTGLATFLLVQIEYGRYEYGGIVLAAVALSYAAISPQVGKLVDAYGQSRVLRIGYAIAIAGRLALIAAALTHQPLWVLLLLTPLFAAGGTQSTHTRARWTHIVPDKNALNTAFSLESSLEEVLFIAGPALATVLATQVASWVPSALAVVTLAIGGYAFLALKSTEPPARRADARRLQAEREHSTALVIDGTLERIGLPPRPRGLRKYRGALRGHLLVTTPALVVTTAIFATQGAMFASVDAATVAFAEELGHKDMAGLVLAVWAVGSLVGGLAYGSRVWELTLASRMLWGVTITGVGAVSFMFAPGLLVLALLMFLTGLAIAPTMAVGDGVTHALVPRSRLTEGMTWTRTGMDLGVAAGAWLAGAVIDRSGASGGFMVTAGAGALGVLIALASWRYLRARRAYEEEVSRDEPLPVAG